MQRLITLLAALTAAAVASAAHAAPHLDYAAATGCPTDTEFVAAVRARGGDVDLGGDATNGIVVAIESASDGYRGTVRVRNTGQSSDAREVRSTACREVADGLAIVTALASQTGSLPDATADASSPAAPPPPAAPPAPAPAAETTPPPRAAGKPAAATRLHAVGQFHDETLKVSSGELRIRSDTAVGLTGGALFGIGPGTVIPRFDLTIARTNFITTPDGAGHIVGGVPRTRWTVLTPTEYRRDGWTARFYALKASIGGCSQLAYDLQGFVVLFCGEIGVGVAKVTTKDPTGHTTKDELVGLGSGGIDFDARYNFGRYFYAGLTLGGEGWLSEIKASTSDGSEIFHANSLGGFAMAGIGLHFW